MYDRQQAEGLMQTLDWGLWVITLVCSYIVLMYWLRRAARWLFPEVADAILESLRMMEALAVELVPIPGIKALQVVHTVLPETACTDEVCAPVGDTLAGDLRGSVWSALTSASATAAAYTRELTYGLPALLCVVSTTTAVWLGLATDAATAAARLASGADHWFWSWWTLSAAGGPGPGSGPAYGGGAGAGAGAGAGGGRGPMVTSPSRRWHAPVTTVVPYPGSEDLVLLVSAVHHALLAVAAFRTATRIRPTREDRVRTLYLSHCAAAALWPWLFFVYHTHAASLLLVLVGCWYTLFDMSFHTHRNDRSRMGAYPGRVGLLLYTYWAALHVDHMFTIL